LDNQVFGTSIFTSNHYDLACWIRSWGSDIFGPEAQKFNLAPDPKAVAATKWLTELRTKHHIAPLRGEAEGMDFNAGHMAFQGFGCYKVMPTKEAVGDKFEWDVVLAPKGPTGLRGYEVFVNALNIYSQTEYPNEAFALISYLTSEEVSLQAVIDQGQLSARISVFNADEAGDVHPIFPRIGLWLSDGVNEGPFPMPANLRFSELHDTFTNYASDLFYGDVEFEEGINTLQTECQKVMDQPRG
jgi:ABC-type glycerol-3-phosphate transport system substrate-binding protein